MVGALGGGHHGRCDIGALCLTSGSRELWNCGMLKAGRSGGPGRNSSEDPQVPSEAGGGLVISRLRAER